LWDKWITHCGGGQSFTPYDHIINFLNHLLFEQNNNHYYWHINVEIQTPSTIFIQSTWICECWMYFMHAYQFFEWIGLKEKNLLGIGLHAKPKLGERPQGLGCAKLIKVTHPIYYIIFRALNYHTLQSYYPFPFVEPYHKKVLFEQNIY